MSFYLSQEVFDFYEHQSEDLLCVCDAQFNIKKVNSRFKSLFSLNLEESSNHRLTDFISIPQKQQDSFQPIPSFIQKLQNGNDQYLWSVNLLHESNGYVFTGKKMPQECLEANLDNYQYFGELADACNEGYFILSRDWKVLYYNRKAEKEF